MRLACRILNAAAADARHQPAFEPRSSAEAAGHRTTALGDGRRFAQLDTSRILMDLKDRQRGAMIGLAIGDSDVEALCALAKHPKISAKIGAFYALGKKTPRYLDLVPLIKRVVQAFSPKRCMWESDCPFQIVKDRYTDSLALVRDHLDFLPNDDRDWLLFRTAERILFKTANA
jgi:Amidohydrolase